jgi:hypothetical protein
LCWKRAQLVAVLSSQAAAPCACAISSDLRKSASADIILSGPAPFKSISALARSVSATSTIIDGNGHWLGGRLNVERVVAEVRAIAEEAQKIPAPTTPRVKR